MNKVKSCRTWVNASVC